jgi:phage recombination protein Bet
MNALIKKFAERFSFAEDRLIDTLKATAFKIKDGTVSDAQMMALLIVADQYSLNPFTKEIYAFPDKQNGIVPVVGVDGWSRIINQHPQFDGMAFHASETLVDLPGAKPCPAWMECILYRKDRQHPGPIREYLDEVYREPYTGSKDGRSYTIPGPWQTHTKRFLRHKTMIQAARLVFGFVGIYDADEAERILEAQSETLVPAEGPVIPAEPRAEVRRKAATLIARAEKAGGAWQAALDYAGEHYADADLAFVQAELRRAQTAWQAAQPLATAAGPADAALAAARKAVAPPEAAAA